MTAFFHSLNPFSSAPPSPSSKPQGSIREAPLNHIYQYTGFHELGGRRMEVTLFIPIQENPEQLESRITESYQACAQEWVDVYLDMVAKTDSASVRQFNFECTKEGVLTRIPGQSKSSQEKVVEFVDNLGKNLSNALFNMQNPEGLKKNLEQLKSTASPLPSNSQKPANQQPLISKKPVGLRNPSNSCWLNSAFQQIATNPLMTKELLDHPDYFRGSDKNPLYCALNEYQEYQKTGRPYDLSKLEKYLKIKDSQEDINVAFPLLRKQLSSQNMQNSGLYSKRDERSQRKKLPFEEAQENPHITEVDDFMTPLELMKNDSLNTMNELIQYRLNHTNTVDQGRWEESIVFESAPDVLQVALPPNISINRRHLLEITLPHAAVDNGWDDTQYELVNFSQYLPDDARNTKGHYITYTRDLNGQFWRINDAVVESISEEEFTAQATQGYVFSYNKKGLIPHTVNALPQNTNESIPEHNRGALSTEIGFLSAAGPQFSFVNFTDPTMKKIHPDLSAAFPDYENKIEALKVQKGKEKWFNKETFTLKGVLGHTLESKTNTHSHIYHVMVKNDDVKKAVTEVLEQALKTQKRFIAFPLVQCVIKREQTVYNEMKQAIEDFFKKMEKNVQPLKSVKIVLTREEWNKMHPPQNPHYIIDDEESELYDSDLENGDLEAGDGNSRRSSSVSSGLTFASDN